MSTKASKKQRIILTIAILVLIIVLAIAITLFLSLRQKKQPDGVISGEQLVLIDDIYGNTMTLDFPHFIDETSGLVYIKSQEQLQQIVSLIAVKHPDYTIKTLSNSIIYAFLDGKACYYFKRSAISENKTYGMLFNTRATQNFTLDSHEYDSTTTIQVPYHFFNAPNTTFTMDYPFLLSVTYGTKLKLLDGIKITNFYEYYSASPKYTVAYEDKDEEDVEARTLLCLTDIKQSTIIWLRIIGNQAQYYV